MLTILLEKNGYRAVSGYSGTEALFLNLLAYLFDPYYTVEMARSSSGLGLSIARRLTEDMGGKMEAEKRDGGLSISVFFS